MHKKQNIRGSLTFENFLPGMQHQQPPGWSDAIAAQIFKSQRSQYIYCYLLSIIIVIIIYSISLSLFLGRRHGGTYSEKSPVQWFIIIYLIWYFCSTCTRPLTCKNFIFCSYSVKYRRLCTRCFPEAKILKVPSFLTLYRKCSINK